MKVRELRELDTAELHRRLDGVYEELRNLRFQHATRQLNNTDRFGLLRGDIARIKTLLRERELSEAS